MQVSKGLKRATGRDEQVQHHLGTLNFCYPLEFLMASSPKVSRLDASASAHASLSGENRTAREDGLCRKSESLSCKSSRESEAPGRAWVDPSPRLV